MPDADEPIRLDVALACRGDTITGIIEDHRGDAVPFTGWLELMSAFDTVCARADHLPPTSTDPNTSE